MSFNEKSSLAMLTIIGVVYGWYFLLVFGQVADTPAREIAYRGLLLVSVVTLIVLAIVSHIVLAIVSYRDLDARDDERDTLVRLRGERVGGWIVSVAAFVALWLAVADLASFWIANTILFGLVVGEMAEQATMVWHYRRGV